LFIKVPGVEFDQEKAFVFVASAIDFRLSPTVAVGISGFLRVPVSLLILRWLCLPVLAFFAASSFLPDVFLWLAFGLHWLD